MDAQPDQSTPYVRGLAGGLAPAALGYRAEGLAPGVHRGLPSPYLTFVISLRGPVITATTPDRLGTGEADRTEVLVGGLHHRPAYIWQEGEEEGLQLSVHPLAAPALFGVPASELGSLVTDGVDLLGLRVARLRERLVEVAAWSERFALLEDYLRSRAAAAPPSHQPRAEVVAAWNWLARHRGTGSTAGLAAYVGLSSRQLGTLFSREVGASPKQVSRLMRFHVAQHWGDRPPGRGAERGVAALPGLRRGPPVEHGVAGPAVRATSS